MKQKMKKVLSLVLSVVLVMTGLTITPATRTEVQAASTDSVFITDKIVPEGETSEDFSKMLYWKGQEIELSVAVYNKYQNEIQWTTSDAKISLVGESDTSTPYTTETASGYVVKQKFKIADDAQGKYTITAKNGDSSRSFDFTVQESYMTQINSTKFSNFDEHCRWTKDQIDLYVVTKAGVEVGFTSDNALVTIEEKDTCDSNKMFYFGKGSEVHKVTAVVGDNVNTDSQFDTATITATITSNGFTEAKKETLSMLIGQSASHVVDSSITVTCDDEAHGTHDTITHINAEKNTIYLDAMFFGKEEKDLPKEKDYDGDGELDKKKVFATIKFQVEGSEVDNIYVSKDSSSGGYFTIEDKMGSCKKVGDNLLECEVVITDLHKTPKDKPTTLNLVSASTHMVTKTLNFVIYTGGKVAEFELQNNGRNLDTDGLTMDEGMTGKFSIKANDDKEKVKWSVSGAIGALIVDSETGEYKATGESGEAVVTATLQDTNSGPRGQTKTLSVIVKKQVAPDKIEILDADKETAVSTTLYVGDNATTFYRQATKNGSTDGIYYSAYQNVLTNDKVVEVGDCNTDGAFTVTPVAKGSTTFYINAEGGKVNSQMIDLKVIAPIKTITIKKDNVAVNSISAVESREIVLTAERDKEASDDETIKWSATGSGVVKFLDDENNECDTYLGNTCRVVTKTKGPVTINAEATGLDHRSKATASMNLTISERVPADSVSFFADGAEIQESITKDTPYEIVSNQSKTFSIKGFSSEGRSSNDEFTGIYEVTVTGTTAKWVDDKGGFEVKAGTTPGVVELTFKNQQTDVTYKFYVKEKNIEFDERFGAGAEYSMGEENIILKCLLQFD